MLQRRTAVRVVASSDPAKQRDVTNAAIPVSYSVVVGVKARVAATAAEAAAWGPLLAQRAPSHLTAQSATDDQRRPPTRSSPPPPSNPPRQDKAVAAAAVEQGTVVEGRHLQDIVPHVPDNYPHFTPFIENEAQYRAMYERSIRDPDGFWAEIAEEFHWEKRVGGFVWGGRVQ